MKKILMALAAGTLILTAYAQEESYLLDDGPPTEEQEWQGFENVEKERQEYEGAEGDLQRQEEDVAPADPQFDPIDSDYRGEEKEGAWEEE